MIHNELCSEPVFRERGEGGSENNLKFLADIYVVV